MRDERVYRSDADDEDEEGSHVNFFQSLVCRNQWLRNYQGTLNLLFQSTRRDWEERSHVISEVRRDWDTRLGQLSVTHRDDPRVMAIALEADLIALARGPKRARPTGTEEQDDPKRPRLSPSPDVTSPDVTSLPEHEKERWSEWLRTHPTEHDMFIHIQRVAETLPPILEGCEDALWNYAYLILTTRESTFLRPFLQPNDDFLFSRLRAIRSWGNRDIPDETLVKIVQAKTPEELYECFPVEAPQESASGAGPSAPNPDDMRD